MQQRIEAIVLRQVPYKDRHYIATLFSKELGVLSVSAKGVRNLERLRLISPLSHGEFVVAKRRSDLFSLHDGTLYSSHDELRQNLKMLQSAGEMVQALTQSQLPGKPAPQLFDLLLASLKQLPAFENPEILAAAFRLKLLTHEGVLSWDEPQIQSLVDWGKLMELALAKSFKKMNDMKINQALIDLTKEMLKNSHN
jgi:DNA repair protein RecO (recombination protein O)